MYVHLSKIHKCVHRNLDRAFCIAPTPAREVVHLRHEQLDDFADRPAIEFVKNIASESAVRRGVALSLHKQCQFKLGKP